MRQIWLPNALFFKLVRKCCFGATILSILLAVPWAPVLAGIWQGREVTEDGILHVMNPAHPIEDPITIKLDELWQLSGDEEDEFLFGVLTQITSDEEGNIYLLDAQLHQVLVFSSQGEFIRTIGREGEGPGEFNRPSSLFMTAGGDVAVMQGQPGKIVLLTPEGEPRGNHPVPEPEDKGMQIFSGGQLAGDRIVLFTERFSRRETGFTIISSLIGVDESGKQIVSYFSQDDTRDFANLDFEEKKMRSNAVTWSAAMDGRVYLSDNFDAYRIEVRDREGKVERVIEREFESRVRSKEEIDRATPRVMIRGGGRTQTPEVRMSKTDRDIQRIYPREDGTLWVLSSRGAFDAPEGVIATFDVYDAEGRFTHQVSLEGEGTFVDDGFHFIKDRLYVVRGLRSARRAMFAGFDDDSEAEDEEEMAMNVICYDLRPIVQSKRL